MLSSPNVAEIDVDVLKVDTIIYTTCGRCGKPLIVPAGSRIPGHIPRGGFSYCISCRKSCTVCAIWYVNCLVPTSQVDVFLHSRLPVRALLFHCAICTHGGHQACYRRYYAQRPLVDLPGSSIPTTTTINSDAPAMLQRSGSGSTDEDAGSTTSTFNSLFEPSVESSPLRMSQRTFQSRLAGRLCAAGCGHFCWATNAISDES